MKQAHFADFGSDPNSDILRQCREQMGYAIEDVQKKVGTIAEIEAGDRQPTLKQLDKLAKLYHVPRWVFIADELPAEYQFANSMPAFRTFGLNAQSAFESHKTRTVLVQVERLRKLVVELRDDASESIGSFAPPSADASPGATAHAVRKWLAADADKHFSFPEWRKKIEDKNVFVFMTGKQSGRAKIDERLFRGFALYYRTLPVIVINGSDAYKARSFTLFHELGHLLRNESILDDSESDAESETWCNRFAGNVLMPKQLFLDAARSAIRSDTPSLGEIKTLARHFKVSAYACIVRLEQLKAIGRPQYENLEMAIKRKIEEDLEESKRKRDEKTDGFARNLLSEALQQYGYTYCRAVYQAYLDQEFGLHKLCQALQINHARDALKLEEVL